jgi:hypothetical protein
MSNERGIKYKKIKYKKILKFYTKGNAKKGIQFTSKSEQYEFLIRTKWVSKVQLIVIRIYL